MSFSSPLTNNNNILSRFILIVTVRVILRFSDRVTMLQVRFIWQRAVKFTNNINLDSSLSLSLDDGSEADGHHTTIPEAMLEPLIKSPPEPTRVKSPEQLLMRSPDPVNWTVPLDTGKTFTVTQNIREGEWSISFIDMTICLMIHSFVLRWYPPTQRNESLHAHHRSSNATAIRLSSSGTSRTGETWW